VFRTAILDINQELVPPQGTVVIQVYPTISWENISGGIEVDFDSGDYEVMCPFVQLQIMPFGRVGLFASL
jgi:hypothetical protein